MSAKSNIYLILLLGVTLTCPVNLAAQSIDWETTVSAPDNQTIDAMAICDSGYMAFGTGRYAQSMIDRTAELLKFDTTGNLLWKKKLLRPNVGISVAKDIVRVNDENNFICSGRYIQGSTYDYIYKINSVGDTIWTREFIYLGFYETMRKLLVLKDKSVLSVGWNQYAVTDADMICRRIDSLGNIMWEKNYPMPGNQEGWDITEMLDGSLMIAGSSGGDNLIMRIGFDGRLINDTAISSNFSLISHMFSSLLPNNELIVHFDSWNGSWYDSKVIYFDSVLNVRGIHDGNELLRSEISVLQNSEYILNNTPDYDSMFISIMELTYNRLFDYLVSYQLPRNNIVTQLLYNDFLIIGGNKFQNNQSDYWIAKIDSVGEEWIPDRCSYQPPVAGFDFEYNYPVLTLRDTSSGGLKYLDTVYTWQWNTSVGTSGTDDSLLVFFDTAISNSIDIELIISNWYGCRDTVNKTLTFEPSGISEYRDLEIQIYPNPVSDYLSIEFSEAPDQEVLFELYDIQGIKHIQLKSNERLLRTRISVLPTGLYFYRISAGSQVIRGKVVKK